MTLGHPFQIDWQSFQIAQWTFQDCLESLSIVDKFCHTFSCLSHKGTKPLSMMEIKSASWGSWFAPWPRQSELTPRIHYVQATSSAGHGASTLALKPMGGVKKPPDSKHQCLHKMVTCNLYRVWIIKKTSMCLLLLFYEKKSTTDEFLVKIFMRWWTMFVPCLWFCF